MTEPSSSSSSPSPSPAVGPERSGEAEARRRRELWLIGGGLAATAVCVYLFGVVAGSSMARFVGFMIGACTFVPLPADAWVLYAATLNPPWLVGLVGGLVNAAVVLVERAWVIRLIDHPAFDRLRRFVGTNRYVDWAERQLFLGLLIGAFSFIPFEPFRLVAIMRRYPRWRYFLATFLGRGFRYYWLARAGAVFAGIGVVRYVIWASLALFLFGLYRSYRDFDSTDGADSANGADSADSAASADGADSAAGGDRAAEA